jgi:HEAT repeats
MNTTGRIGVIALAVGLLATFPLVSEDQPAWLADLQSPDFQKRTDAFTHLEETLKAGRADHVVIQALLEAGAERDHVLKMHLNTLYQLVPQAAIPILIHALENRTDVVRASAAEILGVLGPPSKLALPQLLSLLHDASPDVRSSASFAIGKSDSTIGATLPELEAMLRSAIPQDRLTAVRTLEALGIVAGQSLTDILAALGDSDENTRYWLVNVLGNLPASTPRVVRTLIGLLAADPSAFVRERVARELWEMRIDKEPEVVEAVPALTQALSDSSPSVRLQAVKALQAIGAQSKPSLPDLEVCVKREQGELAEECRKAIQLIGHR